MESTEGALAIFRKYGKSAAQILCRWGLQKRLGVITKSSSLERMHENLALFDFELSSQDEALLDALTTEQSVQEAAGHYLKRRSGTPAPWGEGRRPIRE